MNNSIESLAERLGALEAREAIRELKHRYFRACDQQRPDLVAACFAPGAAVIDYQEFPRFESGQAFAEIFGQMGCVPQVVDMHHGQNPVISLDGPDSATGQWDLFYFNINLQTRQALQLGGTYHDRYVKIGAAWLMRETVFRRSSVMSFSIGTDGALLCTGIGRAVPAAPAVEFVA